MFKKFLTFEAVPRTLVDAGLAATAIAAASLVILICSALP